MSRHGSSRNAMKRGEIRRRLRRAMAERRLVRVGRWIRNADEVDGFVVMLSDQWVLLAKFDPLVQLDGWTVLRVADIATVSTLARVNSFEVRALKARRQWPVGRPAGRFDAIEPILQSAAASTPLISVHRETGRPDVLWVGVPRRIGRRRLSLRLINHYAEWLSKPMAFDLDEITRVEFGGRYEEALHLVGGASPR